MNSRSTLLRCFNGLQEMLASELQKAEYQDYLANLPFNIASSLAIHVFLKLINDFDTSVCLEDCTDKCQIALKSLISGINLTNVIEIWEVKHMAVNTMSVNYVALFQDHSHICTCLLLTNEGLVCRHFFKVMLQIQKAQFTFNLLKSRWYKKGVDLQKINALDKSANFMIDTGSESSVTFMCGIHINEDDHLSNNSEVEHFINKRQIYGECAALGRKLASLAAKFNLTHIAATL
ncbi:unnamed protein product [Rhizophagus irregularis]|nr:unnamed protein product [Rhizophagus irregularis]